MKHKFYFISFSLAIIVILRLSFLKLEWDNIFYALIVICLAVFIVISLVRKSIFRFNGIAVGFVIAALISIVFNDIPSFFRPYDRYLGFLILLLLIGPIWSSNILVSFRLTLFDFLNKIILWAVCLSFVGLVIRLNVVFGRGGFTGLFNHSMVMGPMAAIALIRSFYCAAKEKRKKRKYLYYFIAGAGFICLLVAGSRGAILGCIGGVLFFIYKINQGRLSKFVKYLFGISAILILTFPLWIAQANHLQQKMAYSSSNGGLISARNVLWENRLTEFQSSKLIGIGFSSVDLTSQTSKVNVQSGSIEPGSSWLVILSMTGLLGFFFFVILIYKYLYFLFKKNIRNVNDAYLGGILIFFIIHMVGEGYVLAAGSGEFFYFWLLLGVIFNKTQKNFSLETEEE